MPRCGNYLKDDTMEVSNADLATDQSGVTGALVVNVLDGGDWHGQREQ